MFYFFFCYITFEFLFNFLLLLFNLTFNDNCEEDLSEILSKVGAENRGLFRVKGFELGFVIEWKSKSSECFSPVFVTTNARGISVVKILLKETILVIGWNETINVCMYVCMYLSAINFVADSWLLRMVKGLHCSKRQGCVWGLSCIRLFSSVSLTNELVAFLWDLKIREFKIWKNFKTVLSTYVDFCNDI